MSTTSQGFTKEPSKQFYIMGISYITSHRGKYSRYKKIIHEIEINLTDSLYLQFTTLKSMIQIPLPVLHQESGTLRNLIDLIISVSFFSFKEIMATQSYQMTETIEKNSSVLYTLSKTTSSPYS